LPAIKLIEQRMDVLNVDVGTDYRRRTLEQVRMYLTPITEQTGAELQSIFDRLLDTAAMDPELTVENRKIRAVARGGSIVWFDFATLCGGPRSQNDYLDLASRFKTVILSDVPRMTPRDASAARRFTWLIDVFYDHKIKLLMSAECPVEELYVKGPMSGEFHRTVSRILEMQSREYLEEERREAVVL
jgi:cell division protein ZapE